MENYKPNSNASKTKEKESGEERPKMEKVINGTAKVKKKSGVRKLSDVFISEDAANVKTYILSDVLIPAAKKLVTDIVKDGIDMLLYGSTSPRNGKSGSKISYVSYDRFSDRNYDRYGSNSRARVRFDFDDIIFETRGDADLVLTQMDDSLDRYGFVSVADMYDMAQLTAPFTSNKYGWTNLRNAEIVRAREGGYIIKLPKATPREL